MRCMKAAGLVALAVLATAALAGSAQATVLTSPAGTQVGVGTQLKAEAEGTIKLDGTIKVTCQKSALEGEVTSAGGATATVSAKATKLTLEECGVNTVSVLAPGSLELHSTGEGNATVTSTGTEFTVLTHNILGTVHCIYITNSTDIGTFTGSSTTEATSTLEIGSRPIPQSSTDFGCNNDAELTGNYKFTSPDYLDVDPSVESPLTSPAGTQVGAGTNIKAEAEGAIELDGTIHVTCQKSSLEGEVTSTSSTTAGITLATSTFAECGKNTVAVLNPGTLELHATGEGKGTLTSTGTEFTVLTHNILATVHCIYKTNSTDLGTFKGSSNTGATGTWEIGSAALPQSSTDFGCGNDAVLTGGYKFTSPDYLDVDPSGEAESAFTSPAGTKVGTGTKIHASNESNWALDGTINVTCKKATVEGEVTSTSSTAVGATLAKSTLEECGANTVTVLKPGTLELHATEGGKATITSSGTEITVLTHNILATVHCIYKTSSTDLGTFKGSSNTGATATWEIDSRPILQSSTDFGCGNSAELTGGYKFTSPDYLDVD